MTPRPSSPRIERPIGQFDGAEGEIGQLTAAINRASMPDEKARLAHRLLENASSLPDCRAYDQNNFNCRDFSTLRRKMATVIEATAIKVATASGR